MWAFLDRGHRGSADPSGCLNLSKAELFLESESGSMRLRASGPASALVEGIHSLCSEGAGGSWTGGSWMVVLVQLEVEVASSDGSGVPMVEVLSARTDEDDSPFTKRENSKMTYD